MSIKDLPVEEGQIVALTENTDATIANTQANTKYDQYTMRVELVRALTVIIAVAMTGFISVRSEDFANQQAGLILSGVVGGYFGLASQRR